MWRIQREFYRLQATTSLSLSPYSCVYIYLNCAFSVTSVNSAVAHTLTLAVWPLSLYVISLFLLFMTMLNVACDTARCAPYQ